jgi:hypothetical protein
MDLLRNMVANRQAQGMVAEIPKPNELPKPKSNEKPMPGTKAMRKYIIEKKPKKKDVKEHFEMIIAQECESSSEEDE